VLFLFFGLLNASPDLLAVLREVRKRRRDGMRWTEKEKREIRGEEEERNGRTDEPWLHKKT